jgi:uncharacterized membrane protein YhaH (DUF805 family)
MTGGFYTDIVIFLMLGLLLLIFIINLFVTTTVSAHKTDGISAFKQEERGSISHVLFSYNGRISRSEYWLKGMFILFPLGILNNILYFGVDTGQ